jgi:hypothetical protein
MPLSIWSFFLRTQRGSLGGAVYGGNHVGDRDMVWHVADAGQGGQPRLGVLRGQPV